MSFRLSGYSGRLMVAGLVSVFPLVCCAQQSSTNSPKTEISSAPAASTQDRLKQWELDLNKSLQGFAPKNMMESVGEPVFHPNPQPAVPTRRLKQEQDRRDNWMFQDLDPSSPWAPGQDASKLFGPNSGFDNKQKEKSDLELFYEQLNPGRKWDANDSLKRSAPFGSDETGKPGKFNADSDDSLPSRFQGPAKRLKELLDSPPDEKASSPARHGLADFLGLNDNNSTLTRDQVEAHKAYMDEYRKILESAPAVAGGDPFRAAGSAVNPLNPAGYGGLDAYRTPPVTTPGNINAVFNPAVMQDQNATVLNTWNPLYSAPKIETPRPAPLSVPMMEVPRRKF